MKTTEIFVEQVLIGFIVVCAVLLPTGVLGGLLDGAGDFGWMAGILGVGIAYIVGIPADRLADSLLSGLDHRSRLTYALERREVCSLPDPFPEDHLKLAAMKKGGEPWEWLEYLRRRIRLARALAAFAPWLTVSGVLAAWQAHESVPLLAQCFGNGGSVVLYAITLQGLSENPDLRIIDGGKSRKLRTDAVNRIAGDDEDRFAAGRDPFFRIIPAFSLLAFGLALSSGAPYAIPVALAGTLVSIISTWTTMRISKTFRGFLTRCQE